MSPVIHLFASWLIAAGTTNNTRDRRLVTFAGILPDIDGLGMIVDIVTGFASSKATRFYGQYHHFLWHGLFAAAVSAIVFALFAKQRWRVAAMVFGVFHLHLLCDLIGSRGPAREDLWPIFYLGPFTKDPMWLWNGQWPLDGWANRTVFVVLFSAILWHALQKGSSVVGAFSEKADVVFVRVLRGWRDKALQKVR